MFYFDYDLDSADGSLTHAVFAFPQWRKWYREYGVAVSIDPKGRTNRFGLPCIAVVGTSHNGKSIPFFFGFVQSETKQSYTWYMKRFVECYSGRPPPTVVFTDHEKPLIEAIVHELHTTVRLDAWHLNQNVIKHLGGNEEAKHALFELRHVTSKTEAEVLAAEFLQRFTSPGHSHWFELWWEDRALWVAAWLSGAEAKFCALLNGTNRSEGFNSALASLFGNLRTPLDKVCGVPEALNEKYLRKVEKVETYEHFESLPRFLWRALSWLQSMHSGAFWRMRKDTRPIGG